MGIRQKGLVFIILSLLLHVPASLSLSQTDLNSASVQENSFESKIINEESTRKESTNAVDVNRSVRSSGNCHGGGSSSRRLGASGGRGGGGGGYSGGGSGGGGRGAYGGGGSSSRSPYTPGTGTVIPIIGAGAGAASRHRRSWGCRCESSTGFSTILILLVILLL